MRPCCAITFGGGGWIRTSVGVSQQIYSLPPLATRALLRRITNSSTGFFTSPPKIYSCAANVLKPLFLAALPEVQCLRLCCGLATPCNTGKGQKKSIGAAGGDRTHDPWLRRPILYPLSYSRNAADRQAPTWEAWAVAVFQPLPARKAVVSIGAPLVSSPLLHACCTLH